MLVSILDWIIYFFKDSTSTNLKVVFTFSSLNRLKLSLTGIIRRWPKWLTNIHELCLDCTDLITTVWGWTLTGMVTNQAWTKSAAQSILHTFQASKIIFIFLHFTHELVLYPWIVFRAKKHLICELFSSSLPPSSTQKCCFMGSVASGRQRPSYALLVTDTQWGGATLLTAQMRMFHASRKLYSVDILIWFQCSFTFALLEWTICLVMTNWFEH